MSTIIFQNNLLSGDLKHTRLNIPREFYMGGPKVFISKDNQFAYGSTGTNFEKKDVPILEAEFRCLLEFISCGKGQGYIPDSGTILRKVMPEFMKSYPVNDLILATRALAFRIRRDRGDSILFSDNRPLCIGTSGVLAAGILDAGCTISETYQIISECDSFTSAKFSSVDTSLLDHFVITGDSEKLATLRKEHLP